jgi:crotonobetainyl-CoA:carnitine CoA-transferase CaiB-like acyl-CoA transferase
MARRLATSTADGWRSRLDAAGVPCGVVRDVREVLAASGASAEMGMPPSVPGAWRLPPPGLGEHSQLVRAQGWKAFGTLSNGGA